MEELASEGYVIFAVSHPYVDFAFVYPDGGIVPYSSNLSAALISGQHNSATIHDTYN